MSEEAAAARLTRSPAAGRTTSPAGVRGRGTMAAPHVIAQLVVVVVVALPAVLAISCTAPFEEVGSKWCVYAAVTFPPVIPQRPAASTECQGKGGKLVVLDSHEKLRAITSHIQSKGTKAKDYPYWIGGTKESGVWKWDNSSPINLQSHIWAPSEPRTDVPPEFKYIQLEVHGPQKRRYMVSKHSDSHAPAYLCETS